MKKIVIGILAHVDAGKTTLSEALLHICGKTKKLGRVDNKDAYLDTYELEKDRGITIFSKQAMFNYNDTEFTLLDTPGHVDFSAEMERTLQVLDYAILVISGADGIQGHTLTLWRLLKTYNVPTFIFVNKMDQVGTDTQLLMSEITKRLSSDCIAFDDDKDVVDEECATRDESLMEKFLEGNVLEVEEIAQIIKARKIFPVMFGSALKLIGVNEFIAALQKYSMMNNYKEEFAAKVFKIARDEQNNRLTYMKITGGSLKVKDKIGEEKVNQIRLYSGIKYDTVNEIGAGSVCTVTGLTDTYAGQSLGNDTASYAPILEPVLVYTIELPEEISAKEFMPKLRQIEEEEPELKIVWNEEHQEIEAHLMGDVQMEILKSIIKDRFNVDIELGEGTIIYKETITDTVEGVGHFEPLRHYAEVHLLLEPGERGSGMQFDVNCSEDLLDKNWQRLIMTHLKEREHRGVLTGSTITDIKITIVGGRAHKKHTEGGDFRQATYRAIRQGLKKASSVLLEPYFNFELEVPSSVVGKAITDIESMNGEYEITVNDGETAILVGTASVSAMRNYHKEVISYTKGTGKLTCNFAGYNTCHNSEDVIESIGYDSELDELNPTSSVFCQHGAGFIVKWYEVEKYMHVPSFFKEEKEDEVEYVPRNNSFDAESIGTDEIDQILNSTFYSNAQSKDMWKRKKYNATEDYYKKTTGHIKPKKKECLLVDGYNIIFAWDDLSEMAKENLDAARISLQETLCDYQGIKGMDLIVVFDAYKTSSSKPTFEKYNNISVVFTKEAQTADAYIEQYTHENASNFDITVATSDGLEQTIIRGNGCRLVSARDLRYNIDYYKEQTKEHYEDNANGKDATTIEHIIDEEVMKKLTTLEQ